MKVLEDDFLDPNEVSKKLIKFEDRSRRNNLHFEGLMGNPNESWDDCEQKVQEVLFNNLNSEDNVEIDRCHRFGNDLAQLKTNKRCKETKGNRNTSK